jgi:hypothetical protein
VAAADGPVGSPSAVVVGRARVTYRFQFARGTSPQLAIPAGSAVAFIPRATLVQYIKTTEGLALCGRGVPCPG